MSLENPTQDEYEKMFDTKMSVAADVDGITYSTLTMLAEHFKLPVEQLAGRAIFLGLEPAMKELCKLTGINK